MTTNATGTFSIPIFSLYHLFSFFGRPAMTPREVAEWKQKVLLGVSLKIIAPPGQYDPTRLINWGINRWGTWASLDGNFWWGGTTSLSGITNLATRQTASRIGGTFAWRYNKQQALKFNYSGGIYSRFGGNYNNVAMA